MQEGCQLIFSLIYAVSRAQHYAVLHNAIFFCMETERGKQKRKPARLHREALKQVAGCKKTAGHCEW
ncbi:hypothetical protein DWY22_11885 [Heyndrickxia coagulans]|uniref:Uncharacterized protein n=1 Tax=Heyndrickxia coagulans TaxID=1398 RepID=A0A133K9P2_HEYCO|nr:hypothetical protein HMPREF3213_03972 [Heyndrickxia coagulans]RGR82127.1 hypothetical protein DWY22_11840 [Heyndrickxia coagulans]RGR82136.1 hypothetical protein DWY22_11885 [Heyndrickxia coagulans]RGR95275.1 hypothetical protein DWY16_13340 [Heyndrickxia coagulans]